MRAKRVDKYRNEVRKVNTGINRKNKKLSELAEYVQALKVIRTWAFVALGYTERHADTLEDIVKKCDSVLPPPPESAGPRG